MVVTFQILTSPPRSKVGSSPRSENETATQGTPSTNPTNFTPDAGSGTRSQVPRGRATYRGFYNPDNTKVEAGDDVFLNAPAGIARPQLSPTAQVFTPGFKTGGVAGNTGGRTPTYTLRGTNVNAEGKLGVTLLTSSTPDKAPSAGPGVLGAEVTDIDAEIPFDEIIFSGYGGGLYLQDIRWGEGTFSTDENASRALIVTGIPGDLDSKLIANFLAPVRYPSIKSINASQIINGGLFTVCFANVLDAQRAMRDIQLSLYPARVFPLSPKGLAHDNGKDPDQISDFDGQFLVSICYNDNPEEPPKEAGPIIHELKRLLAQCGEVKAFRATAPEQRHVRKFRVEFFNSDHVAVAKAVVGGVEILGTVLDVEPYQPDVHPPGALVGEGRQEQLSITGRSTVPVDPDYDNLAYAIQNAHIRNGRRLNHNGNHNAVDIHRIQLGIDVRTTIMLRNIPNRVTHAMLKAYVDVTSFGRYDFMYLRIDFANNCNVGYAFINFVDAQSIIPFVLARAGKRWNCFNSDKIAEISYATIQGKDCLVQKFRNSSVMLEHPDFRPKLFITGNVPNVGHEERFPQPDNHSKMRRSIENAEHVGLYLPALVLRKNRMHRLRFPVRPFAGSARTRGMRAAEMDETRHGFYLPPARAPIPDANGVPEDPAEPSPTRRREPVLVNVDSPYDPFAGKPGPYPPLRS